jgi:hypothetical protein
MISFIPAQQNVIAIRVEGVLSRMELDPLMDRLDRSLAQHPRTHIYVEVRRFRGLKMSGIFPYLRRAFSLLGRLDRIGRVAIVADRAWIRLASRIESALLPGIRYQVYRPGERGRAFAWVKGKFEHGETA